MLLWITPAGRDAMVRPPWKGGLAASLASLIDPFRTFFSAYRICDYSYPGKSFEDVIWVT